MKRAVFVLLDQFADWEGAYLAKFLNQSPSWSVIYASNQSEVQSIGGLNVSVDCLLANLPRNIDLLVLIGGNSWTLKDEKFKSLIHESLTSGKTVAAICGAVDYLASNGFLNQYKHTGNSVTLWHDEEAYTNAAGFQLVQVGTDRNLITANGTAALPFTKAVLQHINFAADSDQQVDLYGLGYYQYSDQYGDPFS